MKRFILNIFLRVSLLVFPVVANANIATHFTYNGGKALSSGWFLSSQSRHQQHFDVWQIDSGYAYSITENTQLYLSTQLISGTEQQAVSQGIKSGIKYTITPKISVQSAITTAIQNKDTKLGVELSSQYDVSEQINLRATVDYEELEQIIELGLGFNF